jgi:hypothetical protein
VADRLVVYVASPLSAPDPDTAALYRAYALAAMRDSLEAREAPILPHVMYPRVLDDGDPDGRATGMEAGLALLEACEALIVYTDRGISEGMRAEMAHAERCGIPVFHRSIAAKWAENYDKEEGA